MKIETLKVGNATGLLIPADVAARLGLEGRPLYLKEVKDGEVRITAFDPDFEEAMTLVEGVMDEYDATLRILAK
jgi:antitoxin component of MazEF toxin-antitoxin module